MGRKKTGICYSWRKHSYCQHILPSSAMVCRWFWLEDRNYWPLVTGVQVVMYWICASYLWKQRRCQGQLVYFRLAYITILFLLESLVIASSSWAIDGMFIQNRNYPGGPVAWFLASGNAPLNVAFFASFFILTFMSDLLVVSLHFGNAISASEILNSP